MTRKISNLMSDIYYSKEYVSLYLKEGEVEFRFEYKEDSNIFLNSAIKKPINKIGNLKIDDGFFDLETAYGYGGYYANTDNHDFLCRAFEAYSQKCLDEKIIAEFIRFHPYNSMPLFGRSYFDFLLSDRETVSIDLSLTKQERWSKYSATTRNILRKASAHLSIKKVTDIDAFMAIYQSTMEKNKADKSYYFLFEYYEKMLALKDAALFAIIFDGRIINMSFILFGQDLVHYHLSANDSEFMRINANYYLIDAVCDYSNENYPEIFEFHLGGGRTNDASDSLLAFKSKFSNIRNEFYIAGKIFDRPTYKKYFDIFNAMHPEYVNENYFLKYRTKCL